MPDNLNRRVHFILDEFGQMGKMGSINQLLTQGRSKGAATTILIQDNSQIYHIYGKDIGTSIINSCGNNLTFAVRDEATAEYLSKNIGSVEVTQTNESSSMGVKDLRDSTSQSSSDKEKRLVFPSEIINLPDLHFYAQITGIPTFKDNLDYPISNRVVKNESFIPQEYLNFEKIGDKNRQEETELKADYVNVMSSIDSSKSENTKIEENKEEEEVPNIKDIKDDSINEIPKIETVPSISTNFSDDDLEETE